MLLVKYFRIKKAIVIVIVVKMATFLVFMQMLDARRIIINGKGFNKFKWDQLGNWMENYINGSKLIHSWTWINTKKHENGPPFD